jgi:hypothetical protein
VEWIGEEALEWLGDDESEYDNEGAVELKLEVELGGGSIRSEWEGGGGIADEFKISSTLCLGRPPPPDKDLARSCPGLILLFCWDWVGKTWGEDGTL